MEHPDVTRILRTGYGEPEQKPIGVCKVCGEEVYPWETYGACGDDLVHAECIDDEWGELTVLEKLAILGFMAVTP